MILRAFYYVMQGLHLEAQATDSRPYAQSQDPTLPYWPLPESLSPLYLQEQRNWPDLTNTLEQDDENKENNITNALERGDTDKNHAIPIRACEGERRKRGRPIGSINIVGGWKAQRGHPKPIGRPTGVKDKVQRKPKKTSARYWKSYWKSLSEDHQQHPVLPVEPFQTSQTVHYPVHYHPMHYHPVHYHPDPIQQRPIQTSQEHHQNPIQQSDTMGSLRYVNEDIKSMPSSLGKAYIAPYELMHSNKRQCDFMNTLSKPETQENTLANVDFPTVAAGGVPPPLPPSVEEAYRKKCIELKRRMTEVEESNDAYRLRKARLQRGIRKMRLERAYLLEMLGERMKKNGGSFGGVDRFQGVYDEDSEGSSEAPPTVRIIILRATPML